MTAAEAAASTLAFPPSQANVMLEYDIDEAHALLEKNLQTASRNLETLNDDLDFLQNQITTIEVSILPPRPRSLSAAQVELDLVAVSMFSESRFEPCWVFSLTPPPLPQPWRGSTTGT